jgi:hypothetical protein
MKTEFESVLADQHLTDAVSTFADPRFFDEVPLYSRYKQVEFLRRYGDVDLLLIEFAIDYLKQATSAIAPGKAQRFVAITVIRDADDEYIVPYIFVCNSNVKSRLKKLRLSTPFSILGKQIKTLLKKAKLTADFSVFEDRSTVPDDVRIFISYKSPPLGLMNLKTFVDGVAATEPD